MAPSFLLVLYWIFLTTYYINVVSLYGCLKNLNPLLIKGNFKLILKIRTFLTQLLPK